MPIHRPGSGKFAWHACPQGLDRETGAGFGMARGPSKSERRRYGRTEENSARFAFQLWITWRK